MSNAFSILQLNSLKLSLLLYPRCSCGGRCLSAEYTDRVGEIAKKHGLKLHIDGARIFNASAVSILSLLIKYLWISRFHFSSILYFIIKISVEISHLFYFLHSLRQNNIFISLFRACFRIESHVYILFIPSFVLNSYIHYLIAIVWCTRLWEFQFTDLYRLPIRFRYFSSFIFLRGQLVQLFPAA